MKTGIALLNFGGPWTLKDVKPFLYRLFVNPVVLGAGTPFFPPGVSRFDLRLTETRAFASGALYVGYEVDR